MGRPVAYGLLIPVLTGACQPVEKEAIRSDAAAEELPRARDGDIAIRQELEAARETGTVEAYDLFIARHAGHPLAEKARRERERLRKPKPAPRA